MTRSESSEMPCVRGCVLRGAEESDEPLVMGARHGLLCDSCFYRLSHALTIVPGLVANIRANVIPSAGSSDGMPRAGRSEPQLPISVAALDDADTLYAKLVSWTEVIGGELGVRQPRPAVWANFLEVQGFRPVTVAVAHDLVREMAGWFSTHLESIAYLPVVREFHDDLCWGWNDAPGVFPLMGRWPIEPRAVIAAVNRECPVCGRKEVKVLPPAGDSTDMQVVCGHCRWVVDPKDYGAYADLFTAA